MKLFYFPFTHIAGETRTRLAAIFSELFYLSLEGCAPGEGGGKGPGPGRQAPGPDICPGASDDGVLPLFLPGDLCDRVRRIIADHRQWAALTGAGPGQLKHMVRKSPFFAGDTQVSSIASRIRKGTEKTASDPCVTDDRTALVKALAFLVLAGERDGQTAAIDAALTGLERKNRSLFATLAGEVSSGSSGDMEAPPPEAPPGEDPGQVMTDVRIRSWCCVFQEMAVALGTSSFVLVTTSPAVMAYFEQISQTHELVLDKGCIKGHKETDTAGGGNAPPDDNAALVAAMCRNLRGPATGLDPVPGKGNTDPLTLVRFHGERVSALFSRGQAHGHDRVGEAVEKQGVWVCLVQI